MEIENNSHSLKKIVRDSAEKTLRCLWRSVQSELGHTGDPTTEQLVWEHPFEQSQCQAPMTGDVESRQQATGLAVARRCLNKLFGLDAGNEDRVSYMAAVLKQCRTYPLNSAEEATTAASAEN